MVSFIDIQSAVVVNCYRRIVNWNNSYGLPEVAALAAAISGLIYTLWVCAIINVVAVINCHFKVTTLAGS